MMSREQEESVKTVYRNFLRNDYQRDWTDVDDLLYELDYLSDNQTILESETQLYLHSMGKLKCNEEHDDKQCLVPQLIEAVNAICELYQETQRLHHKNKYVLHNYLVVSHKKIIYVSNDK